MAPNTEKILFRGKVFTRYLDTKNIHKKDYFYGEVYDRTIGRSKKVSLHRYIWMTYNGPIPSDHVIHHKDGNKLNNDIENLECVPERDHLSKYHDGMHRYKNAVDRACVNCGKIFKAKTKRSRYCYDCSKMQWKHLKKV